MKNINLCVIIPVYNSSATIERALDSVLMQTIQPKKIIIVNDLSTDNTLDIIQNFIEKSETQIEFQVITLENNSGPSKARNTGWNNAQSDYIAFLDSDDSWHPQKLEIQYNFMINNPEIKLCGHAIALFNNKHTNLGRIHLEGYDFTYISSKMQINKNHFATTSNIMIKNDTELRFDESMRYAEDYYLWLQFCFNYKVALLNYYLGFAYKDFTGVSGLSGNIFAMYISNLNIYNYLLSDKKITLYKYVYLYIFRTLKFIKVFLKKYYRRVTGQ